MSLFSKLFGKSEPDAPASEEYKGFAITPQPMKEGAQYRLSAVIEKDGKSHAVIRADMFTSEETANSVAIAKAKQLIDEQGDALF